MELREFAKRIVFAETLGEKLASIPDGWTDHEPGPPVMTPDFPERCFELRIKAGKLEPKSSKTSNTPPKLDRLAAISERGRLLHFFANHELLATELMALVLLRFPEAPKNFRQGIVQTLRDEQKHTLSYLERMRCYGIQLGDFPLSGYFWKVVAPMDNPIDYVVRLSLTFEQANLDYCRHFSGLFQQLNDETSAQLLDGIYRDEIQHVAFGLSWFRRWKNPSYSDWDAFCKLLHFPLSPQRAKGIDFNFAGRKQTGLDADFISNLSVYSHSRGRTPNVFLFNSLAEGKIAYGTGFAAPQKQAQIRTDLELLPVFLARKDDVVLVNELPSVSHLRTLDAAGFPLPEIVKLEDGAVPSDHPLMSRALSGFKPWAWGPDAYEIFKPLWENVSKPSPSFPAHFTADFRSLFSKQWGVKIMERVWRKVSSAHHTLTGAGAGSPAHTAMLKSQDIDLICEGWEIAKIVESADELWTTVEVIRKRGHHRIVLKSEFGLAGNNAIRLWESVITEAQKSWANGVFRRGHSIVVEPWLDRTADFSVQLDCRQGKVFWIGVTGLMNDIRGQFIGNYAEPEWRKTFTQSVLTSFQIIPRPAVILKRLYFEIIKEIEKDLAGTGFEGALGIDAFVYRNSSAQLRLKPVVEINPRYTMGRLTLELMRHVSPGRYGYFHLIPLVRGAHATITGQSLPQPHPQQNPIILEGSPLPKLSSGRVILGDPDKAKLTLPVFDVLNHSPTHSYRSDEE